MGTSTLDPDNDYEVDRKLGSSHGADKLGPSNSSDSGSDVVGLFDDANDTDADGTGERATVEAMQAQSNRQQETDVERIEHVEPNDEDEDEDEANLVDEIIRPI